MSSKPLDRIRNTALLLLLTACGRLLVLSLAIRGFGPGWFFGRGQEVGLVAASLVRGDGFSSPFGMPTGPTALIAPGYPLLVAVVFKVLGIGTIGSALTLMGLNVALNTLTCWLILRLARSVAGEFAAVGATLLWACSPPLLWVPTIFWETSLSCCLLIAALTVCLDLPAAGSRAWCAAGLLCALAGLVNMALLPALIGLGLRAAWLGKRERAQKLFLAVIVFCVVFTAWPLRNAQVFHSFIPTRTTVGFELWMGNHEGADGYLNEALFPSFNTAELAQYRSLGEVAYTSEKRRAADAWMQTHPLQTLKLTLLRVVRFWSGRGTRGGSAWFAVHATLLSLLSSAGISRLRRKDRRLLPFLLVPLLLFPLPYYLTHAEFRYRLVLDPLLCVLAASALQGLASWRQKLIVSVARVAPGATSRHSAAHSRC